MTSPCSSVEKGGEKSDHQGKMFHQERITGDRKDERKGKGGRTVGGVGQQSKKPGRERICSSGGRRKTPKRVGTRGKRALRVGCVERAMYGVADTRGLG